jgi:ribosomal protein L11 methyltransferase
MASGETLQEIVIDPGQAFGTGAHATTRLCLELLLELAASEPTRGALIDVGSGSGVLAIAAARLGFDPVLALDHELESVEAARANALVNNVEMAVERFDLRVEQLAPAMLSGGVVLANLLRPLLLELSRSLPAAPRQLVASGLLLEQADEVAEAFAGRLGMHERRRLQGGEWAALLLTAD